MTDAASPTLLKARVWHSRVVAIALIALILVSEPMLLDHMFSRKYILWFGYLLVIVGVLGRVYCSAYIGGRKNEIIMDQGPFSIVRNPLYVFSFIAMVGVGLQSGMITILVLLVASFMAYYPFVVAKEEAFLSYKFGQAYEAYKNGVPRWIPNLKLWREPQHLEVKPEFIRRTLLDASIFFVPLPWFVILPALHKSQLLPVWLTLP